MTEKKRTGSKKKKRKSPRTIRVPMRIHSLTEEDARTEKILIENFVALQRVMTHLSEKFDSLGTQISKMLNLFEISAKALAEKEFNTEKENKDVKKMVEKFDMLLEQNKTIAKGLILLHDEISPSKNIQETKEEEEKEVIRTRPIQNQIPSMRPIQNPVPTPIQRKPLNLIPTRNPPIPSGNYQPLEKYQRSISSAEEETTSSEPPQLPPKFKSLPE